MINKIITLENKEKYLILTKVNIQDNEFLIGIKMLDNKYENEFKIFTEIKKNNDPYLEEIKDKDLINVIVNSYLLDNI